MADEEQLGILREGVDAWNRWKWEHPGVWPDLTAPDLSGADLRRAEFREADFSGADLSEAVLWEADLSRADLRGANLGGAHLSGADLREAHLSRADLSRADLSGADLRGADLHGADLSEADLWRTDLRGTGLRGADLRGARLRGADLSRANLAGVDFTGAVVGWTAFGAVDLSDVKGLESVIHTGPSTIGIDTVYRSRERIPEIFLRGAGVPDEFISYMWSQAGRTIEYHSCFISYSSDDQELADRLYADLQAKNVRCWFAPEDLKIGDKFRQRIDEAIRHYDKLLLLLSQNSVESAWVEKEVETAFEEESRRKRTVLFPLRLDDSVMQTGTAWAADIRRTRHIGDFRAWKEHDAYRGAFERLVRDLKAGGGDAGTR